MKKRMDNQRRILNKGESQRKDGTYCYNWTDALGKHKSLYAPTLSELRDKERALNEELALGIVRDKTTLTDMCNIWLEYKNNIKITSKQLYKTHIDNTISRSFIGKMKIVDIKQSDILKFFNEVKKSYSHSSQELFLTIIKQALQFAYNDGKIPRNVAGNIELPEEFKEEKIPLSPSQEKLLLQYFEKPRRKSNYPLIAILIETGMRIGEAAGLTWDDLDFANNKIYINKQLVRIDGKYSIQNVKTSSGRRMIPMTDKVRKLFEIQRNYSKQLDTPVDGIDNFVFTTKNGTILSIRGIQLALENISKNDMNLPYITPHILRHTACCKMLRAGMDIKAVQLIMGHKSINVTLEIYTHLSNDELVQQINRVNEYEKNTKNDAENYVKLWKVM